MGRDHLKHEDVLKEFDETKDAEFQSYFWGRNRWYRILYHPLLLLTSGAYRFYRFSHLPRDKRAQKAEKWAKAFRKSLEFPDVDIQDIVGREQEISTLIKSVRYHIIHDKEVIKAYREPPPKIFVIKGGTGTGKTYLAQALQKEVFELGIKEGIVIKPQIVKASEIFSMFYGASAAKLASTLDVMFSTPSVILVDEAQQFVLQGSSSSQGGEGGNENVRVESELLQKIDLLQKKPIRSIIIFATDKYENLLPTIRRRATPIDMDEGMDETSLIKISKRMSDKYGVNLPSDEILHTIGQTLRAVGQSSISFGDIVRTFEGVIRTAGEKNPELGEMTQPTLEDFAKAAKSVRAYTEREATRAAKEAGQTIRPPERYNDVGGLEGMKEDIITEVTYALNPKLATNIGFNPPGGLLFYGPPGTGKTLLAKAIAGENNAKFFLIKGPQVFGGLLGESEKTVRDVFERAKKQSPSIIFFDEIDAAAPVRGSRIGDAGASETVLTALLNELEGFNPLGQVVFIAATNRKDALDPALLERLSHQYEFAYPKTTREKKDIVKVHLGKAKNFGSEDIDVDTISKIFLKRVFSPRLVGQTMDEAISYRGKDILACHEVLKASKENDLKKVKQLKVLYNDRFKTIHTIHNVINDDDSLELDANLIKIYTKIASAIDNPKDHPLYLHHVAKAFESKVKDEYLEEARESQRIYRGKKPEIGKTYGLSTDERGEKALILAIEAEVFPASGKRDEKDNPAVLGTVRESIKENAFLAKEFLRKYCPMINEFDIDVHVVSPIEGSDIPQFQPSGFSAGLAIALSISSALGKFPLNPDICMTGRIELKSGLAGLVGGIHPKRGSGKIDVSADEGFKKIIIPGLGFEQLTRDFKDYVDAIRERGTEIVGGIDFLEYAKIASGLSREQIVTKLRTTKVDSSLKHTH